MPFSEQQVEQFTHHICDDLQNDLAWRYEDRLQAMLSEFAQNRSEPILDKIREAFPDEWHKKNIKTAPKELVAQLADLAKLEKDQLLFTIAAKQEHPAFVAIWWPWGHRGTYSLRIKPLKNSYDINNKRSGGFFSKLFG